MGLARYSPAGPPPSPTADHRRSRSRRACLRFAVSKLGADDNRYPVARVPKLCLAANVRSSAGVCGDRISLGPAVVLTDIAAASSQVSAVSWDRGPGDP
jgi:hypothetical protein